MSVKEIMEIIVPSASSLLGLYLTHRKQNANPNKNHPSGARHRVDAKSASPLRRLAIGNGIVGIVFSLSFLVYNLMRPTARPRGLIVALTLLAVCFFISVRSLLSWYKPRK